MPARERNGARTHEKAGSLRAKNKFAPTPRRSPQAEVDQIADEMGVGEGLGKLEALLAAQPELPDGSRLPLTSASEARDLIAAAALPAKRQHSLALKQALAEIEAENADLQRAYLEAQPALQAASAEIAACKAKVEATATHCERWRMAHA